MKRKNIIITVNACLQTLLAIGFFAGLFIADSTGNPDLEYIPVVCFFAFALTQFGGAGIIYYLYREARVKKYLRSVFFIQFLGSAVMLLLGITEVRWLMEGAALIFFLAWIVLPFFQAIWYWALSWKLVEELGEVEAFV